LGKYDLASADWNQAVKLDPQLTLPARAKFYERQGKNDLALKDLTEAVKLDPSVNLLYRAAFYERQGKNDLALAALNQAVKVDPTQFLFARAKFFERQGKFDLALKDLDAAPMRVGPEFLALVRGRILVKMNQKQRALAALEPCLGKFAAPDIKGHAYLIIGKPAEAVKAFTSFEMEEDDTKLMLLLAQS